MTKPNPPHLSMPKAESDSDINLGELLKRILQSLEAINDPKDGLRGKITGLEMSLTELRTTFEHHFPTPTRDGESKLVAVQPRVSD